MHARLPPLSCGVVAVCGNATKRYLWLLVVHGVVQGGQCYHVLQRL
jgi:hypothetical protein